MRLLSSGNPLSNTQAGIRLVVSLLYLLYFPHDKVFIFRRMAEMCCRTHKTLVVSITVLSIL